MIEPQARPPNHAGRAVRGGQRGADGIGFNPTTLERKNFGRSDIRKRAAPIWPALKLVTALVEGTQIAGVWRSLGSSQ